MIKTNFILINESNNLINTFYQKKIIHSLRVPINSLKHFCIFKNKTKKKRTKDRYEIKYFYIRRRRRLCHHHHMHAYQKDYV